MLGETVKVRRENVGVVGVVKQLVFEFKYFDDFKYLLSVLKLGKKRFVVTEQGFGDNFQGNILY